MSWRTRIALRWALVLLPCSASAQDSGLNAPVESFTAPRGDFQLPSEALGSPSAYAPNGSAVEGFAAPARLHQLRLEARLLAEGEPLADGITWRIFGALPGPDGELPLLVTGRGGSTAFEVPAGDYIVHAAFGRAGATRRIVVNQDGQTESLIIDAGGLRLDAVVGEDEPVPPDRLSFEIAQETENGELIVVVPNAAPQQVVRLGAGTYHVISRYGDVNAIVRADIEVEAGKLTEAVIRHAGAAVTLKLVSTEGGEALANTAWTVLTEGGDTVHESVGAFPSMILAEGDYTAVASHQGQVYSRDFTVEAGMDRDIEVRLSDLLEPELEAPLSR